MNPEYIALIGLSLILGCLVVLVSARYAEYKRKRRAAYYKFMREVYAHKFVKKQAD